MNGTPSRAFEERQRRLAHDKEQSRIYDSRLEKLCFEANFDAADRRRLLKHGYVLRFHRTNDRTGVVYIHEIRPEEIR